MVAYLSVNFALLCVLSPEQIIKLGPNAANVALGGKLIMIGILMSIFGCLNGKIVELTDVIRHLNKGRFN